MNRSNSLIEKTFEDLKAKNQKAFIPFLTCGYPDMKGFLATYKLLDNAGADIIEIGIPFSDPLADGPVIQKTSKIAIENRVNTDMAFDAIRDIRKKSKTPIAVLVYFNMVYKYGVERFLSNASRSAIPLLTVECVPLYNLPFPSYFDLLPYRKPYPPFQ